VTKLKKLGFVSPIVRAVIVGALLIFIPWGMGCKKETGAGVISSSNVVRTNRFYTQEEVEDLIQAGTTDAKVFQIFGKPLTRNTLTDGTVCLFYFAPGATSWKVRDGELAGLEIFVKDGKVLKWFPTYSSSEMHQVVSSEQAADATNEQRVTEQGKLESGMVFLFIVNDEKVEGGTYVDSDQTPKLGYISRAPQMIIRELVSVNRGKIVPSVGDKSIERPTLILSLKQSDARAFSELTKTNFGKQLLIEVQGKPVVAPRIMGPIEDGQIILDIKDQKTLELLNAILVKLLIRK
jgi:hypothetical protein